MPTKTLLPRTDSPTTINLEESKISQLPPMGIGMVADFFKVLSEISRIQILCSLKKGPKNVTEIIAETGLGQANVSKHLKILTQAGMVKRDPQGVNVFYEIANPFLFQICDLVCEIIVDQIQAKNQQFESWK
jgi:DNA-binding transcriptional ArsR family regulator